MNPLDPRAAHRPWRFGSRPHAAVLITLGLAGLLALFIGGARSAFNAGATGDFYIYYHWAVAAAGGQPAESLSAGSFAHCPPWLSAFMSPLALLSQGGAAIAWTVFTIALIGATFWMGARDAAQRWGLRADPLMTAMIVLVATLLTFNPLRSVVRNGQVDVLILAGFVIGLVFVDRRPWLSGLASGFAANVKYSTLILLPYLLLRRRFVPTAWTVAFTVAFALLPALLTDWERNMASLTTAVRGLLRVFGVNTGGDAYLPDLEYFRSVSVTSVISRITGPEFSRPAMYGIVGLCGLVVLGLCWCIYRARGAPLWVRPQPETPDAPAVTSLEWCGAMVALLLFSPQTQVRHMVVLGLANLVAVAIILRRPRRSWPLIAGVVVSQLGLNLPSGSMASEETVNQWRAIGWTSWCVLAFFLTMLWTGLGQCRQMRVRGTAAAE